MTRRRQEGIKEADAVPPSEAHEVNPARVAQQFDKFMGMPNTFTVQPLIQGLAREAYPQDPAAASYFSSGFSSGRRIEDQVSKYPIFPVSKMGDFEEVLEEMVFSWSHPTGKYSFDPLSEIHEMIARSDSERAHRALVQHVLLPFNRENQQAWDGPNEMEFKSRVIAQLFEATTYHATPRLNPWAMNSLTDIYRGLRPGGLFYDSVELDESIEPGVRRGVSAPSLRSIRDLQEGMFARMMTYPDPAFDALVMETIETEPVDRQRIYTVLKTLLGNTPKREDGFYGEIVDMVLGEHYDEEVAELFKEYYETAYNDDPESITRSEDIRRQLLKRVVDVEIYDAVSNGQEDKSILRWAIDRYPLSSTKFSYKDGGKGVSGFVPQEGYLADLDYVMGLAKGPNVGGINSTAAYKLSGSFEHDFGEYKDLRAKAVAVGLLRSVLSRGADSFELAMQTRDISSVMNAVVSVLRRVPHAADRLEVDEMAEIMDMRAAFEDFAGDVDAARPVRESDKSEQQFESEVRSWHTLSDIQRSFDAIEQILGERMQWVEIETKPARFVDWAKDEISKYAGWIGHKSGWSGRSDFHLKELQDGMRLAQGMAELLVPEGDFDPVDMDSFARLLSEQFSIHSKLMRTDLRYNNDFRLEHSRLILSLVRRMPLPMKIRTLEMIESGEIPNIFREEEIRAIKKRRQRA